MSEILDLYDENGIFLNRTIQRGTKKNKGEYSKVVQIITVTPSGYVLLTKRSKNKTYPLCWEMTAGAVSTGEDTKTAAVRELFEETGLIVKKEELVTLSTNFNEFNSALTDIFFVEKDFTLDDIVLDPKETCDAKLVKLDNCILYDKTICQPTIIRLAYVFRELMEKVGKKSDKNLTNKNLKLDEIAKKLLYISQSGIEYSKDIFTLERFKEIQEISCEIHAEISGADSRKLIELAKFEYGYATPKVETRAFVVRDNKVLLVKEKLSKDWSLPGGWCDAGDGIGESSKIECLQEAGIVVKPYRLVCVQNRKKHDYTPFKYDVIKCYILAEYISGEFKENIETEEAKYFDLDNLPKNLSFERINKKSIELCFEAYKKENWETIFD